MSRTSTHKYMDVSHFRMPYKDMVLSGNDMPQIGTTTKNGVRQFLPEAVVPVDAIASASLVSCGTGFDECKAQLSSPFNYGSKFAAPGDHLVVAALTSPGALPVAGFGQEPVLPDFGPTLLQWKEEQVAQGKAVLLLKPDTIEEWPQMVALSVSASEGNRIANTSNKEQNVLWAAPEGFKGKEEISPFVIAAVIGAGIVVAYMLWPKKPKYRANVRRRKRK